MTDPPSVPPPGYPRRRLRWAAAPLAAALMVGGFGLLPSLAGAEAPPVLPAISAPDLVAKVISAQDIPGFSGTVTTRTDLGLPNLGSLMPSSSNLLGTLLAPHTITVAAAAGGKVRLAIPDQLAETDVISDGTQLWVWQSASQTVTHLAHQTSGPDAADATDPADAPGTGSGDEPADPAEPALAPDDMTPPAIAARLLASADATTRVFVRDTANVAGRPAYELVLAPRSTASLVADVVIDVDAATGLPLRVQVLAKDGTTPAIEVGFSALDLAAPSDSEFTFTPPPGSTVREAASPEEILFGGRRDHRSGPDQKDEKNAAPTTTLAPDNGTTTAAGADPASNQRQVVGSGWESVVAFGNGPTELGRLGRAVSGAWGSGRLLTSKLVSVLVLDDGRTLVGMVGPDQLEAAVSQLTPAS